MPRQRIDLPRSARIATLARVALVALTGAAARPLPAQGDGVISTIVAPAAPGGGWDQMARTLQRHLERGDPTTRVQVENIPGAAGTVGLARFVSARRGEGDALLVTGLVMVGGIVQNASPVTLQQATPIARLVGEYEVVVVPSTSRYRTLADLVAAFRRAPDAISWGGGSAGGTDQMLVDLIATSAGVDARRANYVAFSGGGEAAAALLGAQVTVGVSGLGEFATLIAEGRVRALAISAPRRLAGVEIPTLREGGVAVDLANWRGVVAPPGITPAARAALEARIAQLVRTPGWRSELTARGWEDLFLPGDAFARFLAAEDTRVKRLVAARRGTRTAHELAALHFLPGVVGGALALLLLLVVARDVRGGAGGTPSPAVPGVAGPPLHAAARRWRPPLLVASAMAADVVLIDAIGFVLAGAILFAVTAVAFGERRVWRIIGASLAFVAAVWLTFRYGLDVPLPLGAWWRGTA